MEEFSYKSNSHKSKELQEKTDKDIHRIVKGQVKQKKKTGLQKVIGSVISDDSENIKSSVLNDIIIPVIKEAISNIFENGSGLVNTLLFGESRKSKKRAGGVSNISYRSYYESENEPIRARNSYSFDSIVIDNRGEAEEVLDTMNEIISRYGSVTVADFYELVGVTGKYTDNKFGWTNLLNASIVRVRDDGGYGYIIKLPKAYPLN